jgi:hypothetical protein
VIHPPFTHYSSATPRSLLHTPHSTHLSPAVASREAQVRIAASTAPDGDRSHSPDVPGQRPILTSLPTPPATSTSTPVPIPSIRYPYVSHFPLYIACIFPVSAT